jgi:hypothetical protein
MQRLVHVHSGDRRDRTTLTLDATKVTPGMPATILHPNDRYAAEVLSASPSGHEVTVRSSCGEDTFTWRKGQDGVGYFAEVGKRSPQLALGFAEQYLNPDL